MKKLATGLTALLICGALSFGGNVKAEAAEIFEPEISAVEEFAMDMDLPETEELRRHHHPRWHEPPPPPHRPGFGPPPPPYHHPDFGPPPPPHRPGFGPPPFPPPHHPRR